MVTVTVRRQPFKDFPYQIPIASKTGTAEVAGKQTHVLVRHLRAGESRSTPS